MNKVVEITIVSDIGSDERIYKDGILYIPLGKPPRSPRSSYDENEGAVQMIDLIEAAGDRLIKLEYVELDFYRTSWPFELSEAVTDPEEVIHE